MGVQKELSIFVDESGSFDAEVSPSRFYVLSLVFHDQSDDISAHIERLEVSLSYLADPGICIHAGPLIRREEMFRTMDIQLRRKLFSRIAAFARKAPIAGCSMCVDKRYIATTDDISRLLSSKLASALGARADMLSRYDIVKIYYDNGQSQVKELLRRAFLTLPAKFPAEVVPERYRLFQVADFVCTLALLKAKIDAKLPLTRSEAYFFHSFYALRKDYLRPFERFMRP